MTSWALLALLDIVGPREESVRRGIAWLCRAQRADGSWPRRRREWRVLRLSHAVVPAVSGLFPALGSQPLSRAHLRMASMTEIDVIVGGGGVAGTAAAAAIQQLGYRVMLIEPRLKDERRLAGEVFHPPGVAGLAELGLLSGLMHAPAMMVGRVFRVLGCRFHPICRTTRSPPIACPGFASSMT